MSRLERLEALLAAQPDDVFLNFGLAMELAKAERWDESLVRFSHVLDLDPNYIAAYFHKGKTLLRTGDRAGARAALTAGIERASACGDRHAKSEMEEFLTTV